MTATPSIIGTQVKRRVWLVLSAVALVFPALAQNPSPKPTPTPQPSEELPVIDGGVGPCSVEFTVTDATGKPIYAANVKVHITYGFAGIRKLDLEAGTNTKGKVKFKGLPVKVHNPPLEFNASKDQLVGIATYDPATECQALHDIMLDKPKPAAGY
jgi:hypothetical protein